MSSFVGWDEPTEKAKNAGSGLFLKLEAGKTYRVRLVSNAVRYFQHWEPVICRSPGVDPKTNVVLDPLMQMSRPDGSPYQPKERYAIWVLDRQDANKLKIMDFPSVLYERFAEWKTDFNEAPGGANGPDWKIVLEARGNDKRKTQYRAERLDKTQFTTEEIDRCKAGITVNGTQVGLKEHLANLRRANTPQEIRDMLAAKGNATSAPNTTKPATVPTGTSEVSLGDSKPATTAATPAAPKGFDF